ncbi:Protein decapping 5 [Apostasia shenzhenica]|uniref:Protein decapping 5 n=1 Tax=Apostasia shenzhenica TaxID=1088818 RepID=A0A2I0A085_9ASPA|nr:Protein decapping 5 [Apostasia shenzhenica]
MAAEASRSGPSADSYIGSLISLTSKSEIRYEGILYSINTEESSIGLRNVRSFGTEGRKKDGPQILPIDKIYEFILFRGSDIKDLQVKSSPPVQATPMLHDPAIIQSHYSSSAPASTHAVPGAIPDLNDASQLGVSRSTFHGGLPLYQPGGTIGSWDLTPPAANGSGLAMPTYWQGFYSPSSNGVSYLQQPSLYHPPPGLPTNSVQQPVQFSNINSFLPSGTPSMNDFASTLKPLASSVPSLISASLQQEVHQPNKNPLFSATSLAEFSSPVLSAASCVPSLVATSFPEITIPTQASLLASASPLNLTSNKPPLNSAVASNFGHSLTVPQNALPGLSNKPSAIATPSFSTQMISQSMSSIVGSSFSKEGGTLLPLVTPGQLMQPGYSIIPSSMPLQTSHKDSEAKPQEVKPTSTSETLMSLPPKEPLLPLPEPANRRINGTASYVYHHSSRGRGRGRGNAFSEPITSFTEEFDFTAMNEKFNKDEVWGHLGKGKALVKYDERELDENHTNIDPNEDQEPVEHEVKPVYCKEDFFDTLSGNTRDRSTRGGRTSFSHQMKVDTETFGDFRTHRWNRGGGRGFRGGRGARGRGYYYGGGGINSRGRGRIT